MGRTIEEDLFGARKKQPINQKQKGNRNELIVAKLLTEWTGHEFTRVPRSGGLRWKNTVNICGDVISTDPSFDFPYSVETKHLKTIGVDYEKVMLSSGTNAYTKRCKIQGIFKQAEVDASRSQKRPMLIIRHNDMPEKEYFVFLKYFDPMADKLEDNAIFPKLRVFGEGPKMDTTLKGYLLSDLMEIPYKNIMK